MISAVITAFISFASTNIDDIFVLMLFFSQVGDQLQKRHIIIGQYLGIVTLLLISIMGAAGLNLIPRQYTGLLGIIPIILGIKEWLKYKKEKKQASDFIYESMGELHREAAPALTMDGSITDPTFSSETNATAGLNADFKQVQAAKTGKIKSALKNLIHPAILNVTLVTLANGADNIGVYIPLFTSLNTLELIATIIIFLLLIALWCFTSERLINFPGIKHAIHKYKNVVVPAVFIVIGVFILVESNLPA